MKSKIKFKGERTRSTIIIIIGLIAFLAAILLSLKAVYTLMLAAVSAMACFELVRAVGCKSRLLYCVSGCAAALVVAAAGFEVSFPVAPILCLYALLLLTLAVIFNRQIKYTDCIMALFGSTAVPYAFSCFIYLNRFSTVCPVFSRAEEIFFILAVFSCSWLTDSFAFLVGRKIGRHKMAPVISPKKSWEGAAAGILLTAAVNVAALAIFSAYCAERLTRSFLGESPLKYAAAFGISCVLSVVSMFGDLSASVLKRNVGIKDYSNLLPGHGGIMDRFDSTLFVLPALYSILSLIYV